jgi:YidC/Oxa1 family membrane protein insertase
MTTVYGDDAFDTYTHFFACGPHHVQEVKAINQARLAPSWHPTNLLKLHAETICKAVLSLNYDLIVRPHPHLYERDAETMNVLRRIEAAAKGQMQIEDPHEQFDSFWSADLMISDWSGVALEYAFATEQPVIFIDAPRKAASVDLLNLNLPAVEDTLRSKVGVIVKSVDDLDAGVQEIFATPAGEWRERIRSVRDQYIFNFESSSKEGARILSALAGDAEMLSPTKNTKKRLVELVRAYS